jgi:hypothetical protein
LSGYLPLCAFRQGLLFETCRTCAWWQTPAGTAQSAAGLGEHLSAKQAADSRRRWMTSLEDTWGMAGLLLESRGSLAGGGPVTRDLTEATPGPNIVGSIHFAPAASVPRLRDLSLGPFPEASVLIFCLACAEGQPRYQAARVLHKALGRLKERGVDEVYAVAAVGAAYRPLDGDRCRFFAPEFLGVNGFEPVGENAGLILMRVDLGGLLSVLGRAKATLKEMLGNDPAPSPAAWTRICYKYPVVRRTGV